MAEIKLDFVNFCNVNRSSPNSCNTSLNQNSSLEKNTMELKSKITRELNQESDKTVIKNLNQASLNVKESMKDSENLDLKNDKHENKKSINNFVTIEDIAQIFKAFQERAFKSSEYSEKDERIQLTCLNLFNFDYSTDDLMIINNENELSSSYPVKIIIPKTKAFPIDSEKLKNLFVKAKFARCRCRFPVPVILYNNKYICRSATLSHCIEIYSRQGYANFFKTVEDEQIQEIATEIDYINLENYENTSSFFDIIDSNFPKQEDSNSPENKTNINKTNSYFSSFKHEYSQCVNDARTQDIALLDYLNVKQIVDLMVEMKKVKYGVNVASSEKADKLKRYRDFNLIVLPYPGCEFFRCYRNNNYQAEDLIFDWNQNFVDADLNIREDDVIKDLNINYQNYKNWDVNVLTLNYLKLILSYLVEPTKESILLHCISGWDRTPLFISLLRLSLWADYELHPNLNHEQILYLTLGYDWYLFGHDLNDRVEKGEEIMHFCFYFLKHLSSIEYSIDYLKKNIVKKGDEYIRTNFSCCGACNLKESVINDKKENGSVKVELDSKLISKDFDEEISSSMYSSMASTIVNSNAKNDYANNFMTSSIDSINEINGEEKKNIIYNKFEDSNFEQMKLTNFDENKDIVDFTNYSKPFEEISSSSSFIAYKNLKNKNKTNLNTNLTTENSDLNKFDVISLDDQSISSNSSYDVLNAGKQLNSQNNLTCANNTINISNQCNLTNNIENNSCQYSSNLNDNKLNKINKTRKNSFTCGSPPHLVSNVEEPIEDTDEVYNLIKKNPCSKLIYEDEDLLSSSGESSTLAEEIDNCSKIQRSNAVAIPGNNAIRERKSKFLMSSNDQINWSNDNGSSNNSNLSNTSNKFSDNSFNLNRCDSWQLVTDTGSIRDKNFLSSNSLEEIKRNMGFKVNSSTTNFPSNFSTPNTSVSNYFKRNNRLCVPTCCCKSLNCGKHCEKVDKFNKENNLKHAIYTRSRRLSDVRALFYQCYSQNIGLTTHTGNTDIISSKFHNLINKTYEKLKYIQFSRTNVTNINKLAEESVNKNEDLSPKESSFKSYIDEFEEKQ